MRRWIKKSLCSLLSAVLIMECIPIGGGNNRLNVVFAAEYEYKQDNSTYKYTVSTEGDVSITGYTGTDEAVEIPEYIAGGSVTKIESGAFFCCYNLKSITFPTTLKTIEKDAIIGTPLKELDIPDNVEGMLDIRECGDLEKLTIGKGIKTVSGFDNIETLKEVNFSEGLEVIAEGAFANCDNLNNITFPSTLKTIGDWAFQGCDGLTEIVIPNSVQGDLFKCFDSCKNLEKLTIGSGIKSLKGIENLTKLKEINFSEGLEKIYDGTFTNCENLTNFAFPTTLKSIGNWAFQGCRSLTNVVIPDGVEGELFNCFLDCDNLEKLTIGKGIKSVHGFWGLKNLREVKFSEGLEQIADGSFANCASLNNIKLPTTIKGIGGWTFENCDSLTDVTILSTVVEFGHIPFNECEIIYLYGYKGSTAERFAKDNDNIIFCEIDPVMTIDSENYAIQVIDSSGKYVENATVKIDCGSYSDVLYTDSNGTILLSMKDISGNVPIYTISKTGYQTYTNTYVYNYKLSKDNLEIIRLLSESESKYQLVYAYYSNDSEAEGDTFIDILNGSKRIITGSARYSIELSSNFSVVCGINGNYRDEIVSYELVQGDKVIAISQDGKFTKLSTKQFGKDSEIRVRITTYNGEIVETGINLKISEFDDKDLTFSFKNKLANLVIPSDVPYIGGLSLDMQLPVDIPLQIGVETDPTSLETKMFVMLNIEGIADDVLEKNDEQLKEYFSLIQKCSNINAGGVKPYVDKILARAKKKGLTARLPGIDSEVDVDVVAYLEGNIDNDGNADNLKGGLILKFKASTTIDRHFLIGEIPIYIALELSAGVDVNDTIEYDYKDNSFKGDLSADISVMFKPVLAIGCKYINIGIYGSGKIVSNVDLLSTTKDAPRINKVDVTADIGVTGRFAVFYAELSLIEKSWNLYTADDIKESNISSATIYNTLLYSLNDMPEEIGSFNNTNYENEDFHGLISNAYNNCQPVIGNASGQPVMVWINDDTTRDRINSQQLLYSVYTNNSWSDPQQVDGNDYTGDDLPYLYSASNGELYLIYQDTDPNINLQDNLDDSTELLKAYIANQRIKVAKFDNNTMSFVDNQIISNGEYYNYLPKIAENNGTIYATWGRNFDTSDAFVRNNTNEVVISQLNSDGSWDSPIVVSTGNNSQLDIVAGTISDNSVISVALLIDEDNDYQTTSDVALVVYKNGVKEVIDIGIIANPSFSKLPDSDENSLVWYKNGMLYSYDGVTTREVTEIESFDYRILSDRIIENVSSESSSNIYTKIYCDGKYAESTLMTKDTNYISNYSISEIDGLRYMVATIDIPTLQEDSNSLSSVLAWGILNNKMDLSVESVFVDQEEAASGKDFNINVDVMNRGNVAVDSFEIRILDFNENVVASKSFGKIASGEINTCEITMQAMNADMYNKEYSVVVISNDDSDSINNMLTFEGPNSDLAIATNVYNINDKYWANMNIINNSIVSTSGTLNIYNDAHLRNLIYTTHIDEVKGNGHVFCEILIDDTMMRGTTGSALYAEIVPDKKDYNNYNNTSSIVLQNYYKKDNEFITKLSCENVEWAHDVINPAPIVVSKYGTVKYLYSNAIDGEYSLKVPLSPGKYFVKAVVEKTERYNGIESSPVDFTITCKHIDVNSDDVCKLCGVDTRHKCEYGDLNEDGLINAQDIVLLMQYLADYDLMGKIRIENADLNADGVIDAVDGVIFKKYAAGYDIKLGQ